MFLPVVKPLTRTILRILSFILFAITALSAYGGMVNPKISAIPAVMVMALPYLALATMLVTVLWFVAGRWITGAIGVVTLIAAWSPVSGAVPFRSSHNPTAGARTFNVMSWNILHGEDQNAPDGKMQGENKALAYILNCGADIICLQEVIWWADGEVPNFTDSVRRELDRVYPYSVHPSEGNTPDHDTHVLSKFPVHYISPKEWQARHPGTMEEGSSYSHFGLYEATVDGRKVLLVNVHLFSPGLSKEERQVVTDIRSVGSAKASAREFKNSILGKIQHSLILHDEDTDVLIEALKGYEGPVIICGDFNEVPESYTLRKLEKAGFKAVNEEVGFGPLITYNRHAMWFQLDHILYRGALRPLDIRKGKIRTSDHYPLIADFELTGGN